MFFCNIDWFLLSHRLNLIKQAVYLGHEVHIVCQVTKKKKVFDDLQVIVHRLDLRRDGIYPLNLISSLLKFIKILNFVRPKILHCITTKPNILGCIANYFSRVPHIIISVSGLGIITSQKDIFSKIKKKFIFFLYRLLLYRSNISVILQNKTDYELFTKLSKYTNRVHLILGSGIDLDKFLPSSINLTNKKPFVILFASRLLRTKGIEIFIDIAKNKNEIVKFLDLTSLEFWVAGKFDSSNPECINQSVIDTAVSKGYVKYKGDVDDMPKLLARSSLLILPTFYGEGLPKIICEAASCGLPCIATNTPGCIEAILDNDTGCLVNSLKVDDFIEKIIFIIKNRNKFNLMSESARKHAQENFDINSITKSHFEIYRLNDYK